MRLYNNSHITEETFAYFNNLIMQIYEIKPEYIEKISTDRVYKLFNSWAASYFSNNSYVNNMPIGLLNLYIEFLKNSCDFRIDQGAYFPNVANENILFSLDSEVVLSVNSDAIESHKKGEIRIAVPEGYDGNRAFVDFRVPIHVLQVLQSPASSGNISFDHLFGHPFSRSGTAETLPRTGLYRNNALFYYSHYTKGDDSGSGTVSAARLKLMANKFSDHINIEFACNDFSGLYDSEESYSVIPQVWAKITYIKSGVL